MVKKGDCGQYPYAGCTVVAVTELTFLKTAAWSRSGRVQGRAT